MESGRPVFTSAVEVPGYSLTSNSPNHSSVLRAAEKGSRWMPYRLNRSGDRHLAGRNVRLAGCHQRAAAACNHQEQCDL
jgi:hypothetical protein